MAECGRWLRSGSVDVEGKNNGAEGRTRWRNTDRERAPATVCRSSFTNPQTAPALYLKYVHTSVHGEIRRGSLRRYA